MRPLNLFTNGILDNFRGLTCEINFLCCCNFNFVQLKANAPFRAFRAKN